jgi:hypothetical protein
MCIYEEGDWDKHGKEGEINWRRNRFLILTRDNLIEVGGGETEDDEEEGVNNCMGLSHC